MVESEQMSCYEQCQLIGPQDNEMCLEFDFSRREESSLSINFGEGDIVENSNAEITQKNEEQFAPIQEPNLNYEQNGTILQSQSLKNFEEECKPMSPISEFNPFRSEESSWSIKLGDGNIAENSDAEITQKNEEQFAQELTALNQEPNLNYEQNGTKRQPPSLKIFEKECKSIIPISKLDLLQRKESSLDSKIYRDIAENLDAELTKKNDEQLPPELATPIQESKTNVEKKGTIRQCPSVKYSGDDKNRNFAEDSNADFTQKNEKQLAPTFTAPFQEQSVVNFEQKETTRQTPNVKHSEDDKNNEKKQNLGRKRKKHDKYCEDNMMQKIKTNIMEYKIFNRLNGSLKNKEYQFYRLHKALSENLKKSFNQKLLKTTIRDLFYYINISDKYWIPIDRSSNRNLINLIEDEEEKGKKNEETETKKILNMKYHDIIKQVREGELDDFLNYIKNKEENMKKNTSGKNKDENMKKNTSDKNKDENMNNDNNEKYMESLRELINNFEDWFNKKKGRQRKKEKNNRLCRLILLVH